MMLAVCAGCSAPVSETPVDSQPTVVPEAVDPTAAPETEEPAADTTPEPEPTAQPETGKYVSGTYTVNVRGMGGKFDVVVTFDAESIVSIEIPKHHETENIGTRAIEEVIPAIIEAQSTDVDSVSGATITSTAIKDAVNEAMAQAKP
jgi:uncharacterized protein with FMN-binding domain